MDYRLKFEKAFRKNDYPGKYIVVEGIDGSGKSTQIERIKSYLESRGESVLLTSEPQTKGFIQEIIRSILFSKINVSSHAYQNLYSADRVLNHSQIVEPALKRGEHVISHRNFWSAVSYGILDLGEEYDFEKLWPIVVGHGMLSAYFQFLSPNTTFYLRVSAASAIKRLKGMDKVKDNYEKKEKLEKIVGGYDEIVKRFPKEFTIIDGEKDEQEVTNDILAKLSKIM